MVFDVFKIRCLIILSFEKSYNFDDIYIIKKAGLGSHILYCLTVILNCKTLHNKINKDTCT